MRHTFALAVCLLACGCPQKSSAPQDAGNPAHAVPAVDNTPEHAKGGPAKTDKPSEDKAEVEITGPVTGAPADATLYIAVSKRECKANDTSLDLFGAQKADVKNNYFIEVFVPQGSTGWLCAYAVKNGEVVAFGTGKLNPMTMKGAGEVMFPGNAVALSAATNWKAPPELK